MFEADQAAGVRKMNQRKPIRVFAVTSGKGGVGKTNISVNLGVSLSEMGHRVALLDADMGLANVDILLGLQPKFNLAHVIDGERSLKEIIVEGPAGLKIIPASSGIQKMSELSAIEQAAVIRSFSEIDGDIDILIVDTAAGISSSVVNFARACHDIIVVLCDEPTSLTDAYAFIKLLSRDYGIFRFQVLANMVDNARQGQILFSKLRKVTDSYLDVGLNLLGAIPYDKFLRKSVQQQCSVVQAYPNSPSSQAFRNLAKTSDSWPIVETATGHLEFFVERMIEYSLPQNDLVT